MQYIIPFDATRLSDIALVGGKGANLGELTQTGENVPRGFTLTTKAYRHFMEVHSLSPKIVKILKDTDVHDPQDLAHKAAKIRDLITSMPMPMNIVDEIAQAYRQLGRGNVAVAVRSSATAEDLPDASFAGQQSTHLNVIGIADVIEMSVDCIASLFNDRAILYRTIHSFDHEEVELAVVIMQMVQSAQSGVMFTKHSSTGGDPNKVVINAVHGYGELMVGGTVNPYDVVVRKDNLVIEKATIGVQQQMMIGTADGGHENIDLPEHLIGQPVLSDGQVMKLVEMGVRLEQYYGHAVDVEWAIDPTGELFMLQTRPATVESNDYLVEDTIDLSAETAELIGEGTPAVVGVYVGKVVVLDGPQDCNKVQQGDVVVAKMTDPNYMSAIEKAGALITEDGGRLCHAAIVAGELGTPCVVGIPGLLSQVETGNIVTVDGKHGQVFKGRAETRIAWNEHRLEQLEQLEAEMATVETDTKVYAICGNTAEAIKAASIAGGVGLFRIEFIIGSVIQRHPKLFIEEGREAEYIEQLRSPIASVCEAYGDRPVVVRTWDYKSDEYENMEGCERFEPKEANPMLGLRGVSRYMKHPEVFAMEVEALRLVWESHKNLVVMLPFVRTTDELQWAINFMAERGLKRSDGLNIWMMAEVPSNVFQLEEFIAVGIDGLSIGSNDLTQFVLGIDRGNASVTSIADERDPAVMSAMKHIVQTGRRLGVTVGLCGQAATSFPEISKALVEWGATSISVSPGTVVETKRIVHDAEVANANPQGELALS